MIPLVVVEKPSRSTRGAGATGGGALAVVALAVPGAVLALLARRDVRSDTWYTLLGGRTVARSGLPHANTLTVLAHGGHWVDQQWLGQLVVYGLWSFGGFAPMVLVGLLAYLGSFALLALAARRGGATDLSVALVGAACFALGLPDTVLRAQSLAYPLFALVLVLVLDDVRRPSNRIFATLLLLVVWANVHGSVLFGSGLVALRAVAAAVEAIRGRRVVRRRLAPPLALLAGALAAPFASPYGFALAGYYRHFLSGSVLTHVISEWAPPTLRAQPWLFAGLALALYLAARQRGVLGPVAQLALAAAAVGALLAVRNGVWFALVAAAVVPGALDDRWRPSPARRRDRVNRLLAVGSLVVLAAALVAVATRPRSWFERSYPSAAAAAVDSALRSDPTARVLATDGFADWLLVEAPRADGRVAFDIRYELLTDRELEWIVRFAADPAGFWAGDGRGYRLLVVPAAASGGRNVRPPIRILYRDARVAVLERSG